MYIETLVLPIVLFIACVILYYKWCFNYSDNSNIPTYQEPSIPFGNVPNLFTLKTNPGIGIKNWHLGAKHLGYKIIKLFSFTNPWYCLIDPQYIKLVVQNDFDHFVDRGFYYNERDDPLSANLFAIGGEKWRFIRTKLSPTFTAVKLKGMFETLLQSGYQLQEAVESACKNKQQIHVKDLSTSYSINVIGSCAFGVECNCFKEPNAEFKRQGKEIFRMDLVKSLRVSFSLSFPELANKLGIRLFSKAMTDFFVNLVKGVIQYRRDNNVTRKDMMQLLMELYDGDDLRRGSDKTAKNLNFEEITAQAFIFFAAGFETSSITLTYCLYELAINDEVQSKLRDEISEVLQSNDGKVTYDAIMEMKYITQVIEETLRKYPPVMYSFRTCVKEYKIPGTDYMLRKGSRIVFSALGLHHDPEYFPNPDEFDPERFSPKNKPNIPPFCYIPFGEGPRICIGLRFAMMQLKVALALLLSKYKFTLNGRTKQPIEVELFSFTMMQSTEIYLNVEEMTAYQRDPATLNMFREK